MYKVVIETENKLIVDMLKSLLATLMSDTTDMRLTVGDGKSSNTTTLTKQPTKKKDGSIPCNCPKCDAPLVVTKMLMPFEKGGDQEFFLKCPMSDWRQENSYQSELMARSAFHAVDHQVLEHSEYYD